MPPLSLVTVLTRVSVGRLVVVVDGAGDAAAEGDGDGAVGDGDGAPGADPGARGVAGRAAGLGQVVGAGVDARVGDRPGRRRRR